MASRAQFQAAVEARREYLKAKGLDPGVDDGAPIVTTKRYEQPTMYGVLVGYLNAQGDPSASFYPEAEHLSRFRSLPA